MRSWIGFLVISALWIVETPVFADGETPPLPIEAQTFRSFAECRSFLDAAYKADLRKADPRPVPIPSGEGSTQTLIFSEGPKTTGPQEASYEATEGWSNRTPVHGAKQIMTTYSYRTTRQRCAGRHLTGESFTGYGLEGYEPAPQGGQ